MSHQAWADDAAETQLLRQQERDRQFRLEQENRPDVRLHRDISSAVSELIPLEESPCFPISSFILTGDEADRFQFALSSLKSADDPANGRCLGVQGINAVLARVQNAIVAEGFVTTRVLASPQDLTSGTLTLTVIPGRIHAIRFTDDSSPRGRYWNALPAKPGDLLNLHDIEQALENLKRSPTSDADIQIEPAGAAEAGPGQSDLVIRYRQGAPFRLTLTADDGGSRSTGRHQGTATISGDNLLTLNDLFYFSFSHDMGDSRPGAHGTLGRTLHYSLPYGYWQLGATVSEYRYHQTVAGINQNYLYSGHSTNAEIKLSRLIRRDATSKTTASIQAYLKTSGNAIDGTEIEVQRRRMAGWQLGMEHRQLLGQATWDASLAYRFGTGMLGSLPAPEQTLGEGTSRPRLVNADLRLTLPFRLAQQRLRYQAHWRGQWNDTSLVPQDRFAIGGRYTVRGFDGETILAAERGWLIRNDLALNLGPSGQELYWGLDYGQVGGASAVNLVGQHLAGAVIGMRGGYGQVSWDIFAGGPLSKPEHFKPATGTAGFNLSWTY